MTIPEVAEQLSIQPAHVYRLIYSGELPAVDVGRSGAKRRTIRIRPEDVERFIEGRTKTQMTDDEAVLPPSIRRRLQVVRGKI